MRVWFAVRRQRGPRGSRGEATIDLVVTRTSSRARHETLEPTTVTVTLTGGTRRAVFACPWAMAASACPARLTVNGASTFHVDGVMRVEQGTAPSLEPRYVVRATAFAAATSTGQSAQALTEDLATYYGTRAPVGLFSRPASYGASSSWGERLVIEEETPARFGVFYEYKQGSTPNVYAVRGPSATMRIDPDGLAFSFARRGSNAMDYPDHAVGCEGRPPRRVCTAPSPSVHAGALEVEVVPQASPPGRRRGCSPRSAQDPTPPARRPNGKATCWSPTRR